MLKIAHTGGPMFTFKNFLFTGSLIAAQFSFAMDPALLKTLGEEIPRERIADLSRTLVYTNQGHDSEAQAELEVQRLTNIIISQVHSIYSNALAESGDPTEAREQTTAMIQGDLENIAPELRDEMLRISEAALEDAVAGKGVSQISSSKELQQIYLKPSLEDSTFLRFKNLAKIDVPFATSGEDAEKRRYSDVDELLRGMTSAARGARWMEGFGIESTSENSSSRDGEVSVRFKAQFLGVEVEAGPVVKFSREVKSTLRLSAEGRYPISRQDGTFDLQERDSSGKVISNNRYAVFYCDLKLDYTSETVGSGGFSVAGAGARASLSRRLTETVSVESRRLMIPEFIGNTQITIHKLREICQRRYINAKVNSRMTVRGLADVQLRNQLAGVIYSNPKTQCGRDSQCVNWYRQNKRGVYGPYAYPRCVTNKKESFRYCMAAASINRPCPVFDKGKRVSNTMFELPCDYGLKCVTTKEAGVLFWQYAEGKCMPKSKNYKRPSPIR